MYTQPFTLNVTSWFQQIHENFMPYISKKVICNCWEKCVRVRSKKCEVRCSPYCTCKIFPQLGGHANNGRTIAIAFPDHIGQFFCFFLEGAGETTSLLRCLPTSIDRPKSGSDIPLKIFGVDVVVCVCVKIGCTEYEQEHFGVTKCRRKRSHYYVTKVYRDLAVMLLPVPGSKDLSFC